MWRTVQIVGAEYRRPVPLTPAAFERLLSRRTFTNGSDKEVVLRLYAETFEQVMAGAQVLDFYMANAQDSDFSANWGDDELVELVTEVLPHCKCLESLVLGANDIGDRGAIALADSGSPTLQVLVLRKNRIENAGLEALAAAIQASRFPNLDLLQVQHNPGSKMSGTGRTSLEEACRVRCVSLVLD